MGLHLILDVTDSHNWSGIFENYLSQTQVGNPVRIPSDCRATVLQQGSEEQAQQELLRLLRRNPNRQYALFSCEATCVMKVEPWAVTAGGKVIDTVQVPRWEAVAP